MASFMAISTARLPCSVNPIRPRSPGAASVIALASSSSGTESKLDRRWLSWRACANAASTTSGCEAPMLFDQAIEVQSMYSLPLASQTSAPEVFVMTRPGSLPVDHPLSRAALPSARSSSA